MSASWLLNGGNRPMHSASWGHDILGARSAALGLGRPQRDSSAQGTKRLIEVCSPSSKRSRVNAAIHTTAPVLQPALDPEWGAQDEEQASADQDTIAAIVTGLHSGSIAIIRLSGSDAFATAHRVFRPSAASGKPAAAWQPKSHQIYHGHAVDEHGTALDEVLLLPMRGPRSFTAEDVVEIHGHGGLVCAPRILDACLAAGARRARNGEFTLRAFLNGRLDLSQAEAVAQLVGARSAAAADSALAGLQGGIGSAISALRLQALTLLADIEARLDFEDEVEEASQAALYSRMQALQQEIDDVLSTRRRGTLLHNGLQVALVGRPNVGKSSLLNELSGHERAIVTAIPGTTRDIIEAEAEVAGVPVRLLDTAGLRVATDAVEQLGVERARAAAAAADIIVLVYDAEASWTAEDSVILQQLLTPTEASTKLVQSPMLIVQNKVDLLGLQPSAPLMQHSISATSSSSSSNGVAAFDEAAISQPAAEMSSDLIWSAAELQEFLSAQQSSGAALSGDHAADGGHQVESRDSLPSSHVDTTSHHAEQSHTSQPASLPQSESSPANSRGILSQPKQQLTTRKADFHQRVLSTSAAQGTGLQQLRDTIALAAGCGQIAPGGVGWAVNERQGEALAHAKAALQLALDAAKVGQPLDMWTPDLHECVQSLGEVSGQAVDEDVLDSVFSRFCIGK